MSSRGGLRAARNPSPSPNGAQGHHLTTTHHPINLGDLRWLNDGINAQWAHCPPTIPASWKDWWYVPVCGGAQAEHRYARALNESGRLPTPLPYEPLQAYLNRQESFVPYHANDGNRTKIWQEFSTDYEPWAPVTGLMLSVDHAELLISSEEEALMAALWAAGTKWTNVVSYFPNRTEANGMIVYLRFVLDGVKNRSPSNEHVGTATQVWLTTHSQVLNKYSYVESAVTIAFQGYGLSWSAISDELDTRSPTSCKSHWEKSPAGGQLSPGDHSNPLASQHATQSPTVPSSSRNQAPASPSVSRHTNSRPDSNAYRRSAPPRGESSRHRSRDRAPPSSSRDLPRDGSGR